MSASRPRAIFFGTPEFSVPCLDALAELADVSLVVTQPDRPSGRGMRLRPPPVKERAAALGIEVIQPRKVRTVEFRTRLEQEQADVAVVVAYGRILPSGVLDTPRHGCVNVHASLLPKLRGAAPIQWAIVRGERVTGVCLMQMDEGMDTGPVLARAQLAIGAEETAGELSPRLSSLGAELLSRELPPFLRGERPPQAQDAAAASMAPVLSKQDGRIRWGDSAGQVHDRVRGMTPWPGAHTLLDGRRVKVHRARVRLATGGHGEPGQVLRVDRHGLEVACGEGILCIDELQMEGKRRMTVADYVAGHALPEGAHFTDGEQ